MTSPIISSMRNLPYPTGYAGPGPAKSAPSEFDRLLEDFQKAATQTPAERAREAVLKRHRLDEDGYKALPADQKVLIDKEVAEAVKQQQKRSERI